MPDVVQHWVASERKGRLCVVNTCKTSRMLFCFEHNATGQKTGLEAEVIMKVRSIYTLPVSLTSHA
jgi:hypothetical protein